MACGGTDHPAPGGTDHPAPPSRSLASPPAAATLASGSDGGLRADEGLLDGCAIGARGSHKRNCVRCTQPIATRTETASFQRSRQGECCMRQGEGTHLATR